MKEINIKVPENNILISNGRELEIPKDLICEITIDK